MNLIEMDNNPDPAIRKVFLDIMEISNKYKSENLEIFPLRFDQQQVSYYVERRKRTLNSQDFENADCQSSDELMNKLITLWTNDGYQELAHIAESMKSLADQLKNVGDSETEVSPFIYVMF